MFDNIFGQAASNYRLLEEKVITTKITSFDFGLVLDGNKDEAYQLDCLIVNAEGAASYSLRLNGAGWVIDRQSLSCTNVTITSLRSATSDIGSVGATNSTSIIFRLPRAKTGYPRHAYSKIVKNVGTAMFLQDIGFVLTTPDDNTNIISLGLSSSAVNGIGAGSILRLYRLRN